MIHPRARILKRVWWTCICRDRLLALGVRRSLQIGPCDFDFTHPAPDETDFVNEIHRSQVYEASSKRQLVELFRAQCELAVALTDCLNALFPRFPGASISDDLPIFVYQLERWFKANCSKICPSRQERVQNESVVLYTNLLLAYYQ
jgi:hypothetical protein